MAVEKPTRKHSTHRTLFLGALGTSLAVISYLAFTPLDLPGVSSLNDKFSHLIAFFSLAFLADYSWPDSPWNQLKFFLLLGYGLFIEAVQAFLPYRLFSLFDLTADALGLIVYTLIAPWLMRQQLLKTLR
ncbi:MAG: VanZ family protein [Candidatus Thiodiazotropha sp. LLP2]